MFKIGLSLVGLVTDFSASVDAFTVRSQYPITYRNGWLYVEAMRRRGKDLGIRERPANVHGYVGGRVGSVQWGEKDGRILVMVTGKFAEEAMLLIDPIGGEVTRMDCQITCQLCTTQLNVASAHGEWLASRTSGKWGKAKWRVVKSDQGETFYLGKRDAERFFRIYDKGGQQGEELGKRWRWEVELKGETAARNYEALRSSPNKETTVMQIVYTEFHKREVRVPVEITDRPGVMEVPKAEKGRDQYLQWIEHSVRPVVRHLRSLGECSKLYEALGIQPELISSPNGQKGDEDGSW